MIDQGADNKIYGPLEVVTFNEEVFKDRRQVKGFSTDNEGDPDPEQVKWVEKLGDKKYRIWVSIADASVMVDPKSEWHDQALVKKESKFHPTRDPMLGEDITYEMSSLAEGKIRPTVTLQLDYDADSGQVSEVQVYLSYVENTKQVSYADLEQALEKKSEIEGVGGVEDLEVISESLRQRRKDRGEVVMGGSGEVARDFPRAYASESELMALTNELLAQFCLDNNIPILYRNYLENRVEAPIPVYDSVNKDGTVEYYDENYQKIEIPPGAFFPRRQTVLAAKHIRHDLLNRPHGRFSAPLRDVEALINMQQLAAWLAGGEVYSAKELERFALGLNQFNRSKAWEKRRRKGEKVSKNSLEEWLDLALNGEMDRLSEGQLARVFRNLDESGDESDEFWEAWAERCESQKIPAKIQRLLVFERQSNSKGWKQAASLAWERMQNDWRVLLGMINFWINDEKSLVVTNEEIISDGPDHSKEYRAIWRVEMNGQAYESTGVGSSKKTALINAKIKFLEQLKQKHEAGLDAEE